jgi:hypothetical protein
MQRSRVARLAAAVAFAAILPPAAMAQAPAAPGFVALGRAQAATGHPFSGEWVTTRVQTLADGTQVTYVEKEARMRDAEGRLRIERYASRNEAASEASEAPASIDIVDPVAGQIIRLDPSAKTARITALAASVAAPRAPTAPAVIAPPAAHPLPRPRFEPLGTQSIDDVDAIGTRITQVIPAGAQGNDRELTVVHESWFSPDLKVDLLVRHSDPRSGEASTEAQNLSLDEPDPALFQIPEGYRITGQQPQ